MADIALADVCEAIVDCEHKTAPVSVSGYPSIRTTNIKNGRLDLVNCNRIDQQTYEAWTQRRRPVPGDLILAREAPVGEVGIIPPGESVVLGQRTVLICPDRTKVDPHYLLFIMIGPEMRHRMTSKAGGSTVDHLNMRDIRALPLPELPSLPEQRAIAAVLGALDDKIEVNRKQARVLEGIARAVFKSWFVDFDPVRRKAAGEPTGLPDAIAALFPDRLVESAMGKVPEGWRTGTLGDEIDAVGGGTPSTSEPAYWEGGAHAFCTPKDMSALNAPVLLNTERQVTDAGLAKINSGLLPPGTVIMSSRAPIGYLAITEIPVAVNQGIIAMRGTRGWSAPFILRWCEAHMDRIEANANGSTFQEISKKNFRPIASVLPDRVAIGAFERVATLLHQRVVVCERQSAALAGLRDTLLPKLVSGELRIADAEHIVDETAGMASGVAAASGDVIA